MDGIVRRKDFKIAERGAYLNFFLILPLVKIGILFLLRS